jgi:mRNA-degrading endonuclease RelE of RelBE toxin-antitoxin system
MDHQPQPFKAASRSLSVKVYRCVRGRCKAAGSSFRPNDLSAWELRVGMYRVFYDVDPQQRTVRIKAVGWKERDKLVIRGKELTL